MENRLTFTAALLAGTFLASSAGAATIEVYEEQSIQDAINKAGSGDTVLVQPGTYSPFDINKDNITVKSAVPGGAHVVATGNNQPAIAAYGQSNIAILDFKLTSYKGDGMKVGGSPGHMAKNILVEGNVVETAWLDGLKAFQASNVSMIGNTIKVSGSGGIAGKAGNPNGDGGVDFVQVVNSEISDNVISSQGWACMMVKGGSGNNKITDNDMVKCSVNGLDMAAPTGGKSAAANKTGMIAFDSTVSGNTGGGTGCAVKLHEKTHNIKLEGNDFTGSTCDSGSGNGATAQGANGIPGTTYAGGQSTGGGSSESGGSQYGGSQYGGMTATLVSSSSGGGDFMCSGSFGSLALAAVDGVISMLGGGRASQVAQGLQIKEAVVANFCAAQMNDKLNEQIIEQRRMTAGIGGNVAGKAGSISNGVGDTLELSTEKDMEDRYQSGASGDLSPDDSLAYHKDLKASTDKARRNALETAAKNAEAEKEYSKMADDALELSQSAQGQTGAIQAQTQMERAKEGADASRASTQVAFEHARLMTEEENRANERLAQQRREPDVPPLVGRG